MHSYSRLCNFAKAGISTVSPATVRFFHKTPPYKTLRTRRPVIKDEGMKIAPIKDAYETPRENKMLPGLLKSFVFTSSICGTLYVGAAIVQYERIKSKLKGGFSNWVQEKWNSADGWENKEGDFRKFMNKWWNDLSEGQKVFWGICALNAVVLGCWQNPALKPVMLRYFCSSPAAKAVCWPMLLSTFSHYSLIHFGMNMFVLHSFSEIVGHSLGREQMIGFYLSGGLIAALTSQASKVMTRCIGPSLGASGAIMALLGYFCMNNPNAQLGIVFIPGITFSADSAIKCVMAIDFAGIIFGWRLFDHAAHLGGALFGVLYALYGHSYIWSQRTDVVDKWQTLLNKYYEQKGKNS